MSLKRLDVIIFGASGYTGKYTVFEAVKVLQGLSWGIAGRNQAKLESVLSEMGKKADKDLSKTPIIIADVGDEKSLLDMAKKAKIIVNCCGPYRLWGEQVVKACIEAGSHHVDVSGEPQYMETMQLKYNDQAREKGVYIVSACGVESIPADMGTIFLQQNFEGTVNSVENFLYLYNADRTIKFGANYGSWESAVHVLANEDELTVNYTNNFSPKLKARNFVYKSKAVENLWCVSLPYPDQRVVARSQQFLFEQEKQRPAQTQMGLAFNSIALAVLAAVSICLGRYLLKFKFLVQLLLNYPELFSFGYFSRGGPKEEQNENLNFEMTCYGKGWKEKTAEPTEELNSPINKKMIVRVSGKNAGYGATCVALLVSATTILKDSSKMPGNGGVLAPGAAFKNTTMIDDLHKNGIKFEVVKVEE